MVSKSLNEKVVCVVGLGYVGQPLAEAFAEHIQKSDLILINEQLI